MEAIRNVSFCPHCGNKAPQELIYVQNYILEELGEKRDSIVDAIEGVYFVAVCETCKRILLYGAIENIPDQQQFNSAVLYYPDSRTLHTSVPESITRIYKQAISVKVRAPDAFAVLIRKALEAVCYERGANKENNLATMLNELKTKQIIPPFLANKTKIIRLVGNAGAHAGDHFVENKHIYLIDDFFHQVVDFIYVNPSKDIEVNDTLHYLLQR
jgi:predicted nucleic-acid-binding Zn-ribbon protein